MTFRVRTSTRTRCRSSEHQQANRILIIWLCKPPIKRTTENEDKREVQGSCKLPDVATESQLLGIVTRNLKSSPQNGPSSQSFRIATHAGWQFTESEFHVALASKDEWWAADVLFSSSFLHFIHSSNGVEAGYEILFMRWACEARAFFNV